MSKKTKVITSNIQPNPKEAEIWAKINEDGSREVKQYNSSTGKFECCGGSGNGSGSGENSYTYIAIDNVNELTAALLLNSYLCKYTKDEQLTINTSVLTLSEFSGNAPNLMSSLKAVCIDLNNEFIINNLINQGAFDSIKDIPSITKEQFYNLEA